MMRQEIFMPRMGQSMDEGRVQTWLKRVGDAIERGEIIAEIETDKAVVEMEALVSGTIVELVAAEGALVPVGTAIAYVDDGQPGVEMGSPPAEPVVPQVLPDSGGSPPMKDAGQRQTASAPARVNASPVARRLAEELGIDLAQVTGSGPGGRINRTDVETWYSTRVGDKLETGVDDKHTVTLSRIKQTTARRMTHSKGTVPHFYLSMDVEMDRSLDLRDRLNQQGMSVSVNDLILKATATALARHPYLNAEFRGGQVFLHPSINLSFAVAVDDGLLVPVIPGCERLSLVDISQAARAITERARAGQLRQADLEGGTFTVSNLGMYGVRQFEAIINPPQAAILAVGAIRRVPVFDNSGALKPASVVTATVSADHRVTDGAQVAAFLTDVRTWLEGGFVTSCLL